MAAPIPGFAMGQGSSFQLANDDRFQAATGDFNASPVNTFNPFAGSKGSASGLSVSVGWPIVAAGVLGLGGLLYAVRKGVF